MKFSELRPINESAVIADVVNNQYCMDGISAAVDAVDSGNDVNYELNDGTTVTITPELGAQLIAVYSELNGANADSMNVLLKDSEESFIVATEFCESVYIQGISGSEAKRNGITSPVNDDAKETSNLDPKIQKKLQKAKSIGRAIKRNTALNFKPPAINPSNLKPTKVAEAVSFAKLEKFLAKKDNLAHDRKHARQVAATKNAENAKKLSGLAALAKPIKKDDTPLTAKHYAFPDQQHHE